MKRMLVLLFLLFSLSIPVFAIDIACEPESDTSVSYSIYTGLPEDLKATFVNYADKNIGSEYWLRLNLDYPREKISYYIVLNIDGSQFRINSISADEKHIMAGQSFSQFSGVGIRGMFPDLESPYRYYPLSPDIISKLVSAKSVSIIFNSLHKINIKSNIPNNFLIEMQNVSKLTYLDYIKYWNPKQ